MKNFNFHPLARIELDEARLYLNQRSIDTADRFVDAVDQTFGRIRQRPGGGRPTLARCRLYEVPGFLASHLNEVSLLIM